MAPPSKAPPDTGRAPDLTNKDGQDDDEGMENGELCIPLSALAAPDEKDNMVEPQEGDIVPFSGECQITRVQGKNAYATLTAVNGQKIDENDEDEGPPGEDEEEASIRADLGNGGGGGSGQDSYVSTV